MNKLHDQDSDLVAGIIDLRDAVDFRNLLTHGYHKVDNEDVWDIITDDLPVLYKKVCALHSELDPQSPTSKPPSGPKK